MKIKNVSVKVIGLLGRDLMPDESMNCNESLLKNGSVATLVKMGFLAVDDSAEKQKALEEEIREKILKEQADAAAKVAAEAAAKEAAETAPPQAPVDPEATEDAAPAEPKRTRRVSKPTEPAAE